MRRRGHDFDLEDMEEVVDEEKEKEVEEFYRKERERVKKVKAEAKARILDLQGDGSKTKAEIERWLSSHFEKIYWKGLEVKRILKALDGYVSHIAEEGITEAWMGEVAYQEMEDWDGVVHPLPLWAEIVLVLDEGGCTDEEAERAMRRIRELFKHVMEKMGFLEPVSESKEAEKVDEAQAPTDRGIEWVRAAFLNKLKNLDVDIGEDFFIIEEIGEGRFLVKGKGYLERPIWGALNELVRMELGGRYDPSERGWVIG